MLFVVSWNLLGILENFTLLTTAWFNPCNKHEIPTMYQAWYQALEELRKRKTGSCGK